MLDIEIKEIYYSKTLSWLLNPQGNHHLGDIFLRDFLKILLRDKKRKEKFVELDIEYIDLDCVSLENVKVSVEQTILSQKKLDIFVQIDTKSKKWILVIENKINSTESPKQTQFYTEELRIKYPNPKVKKICIFLTPKGIKPPSSKEFMSCKWSEIYIVLKKILKKYKISNEIKYFLEQFKNSISVYVMENRKLDRLCEDLFDKYPNVIEFLIKKYEEYRKRPYKEFAERVDLELRKIFKDDWKFEKGNGWNALRRQKWIDIQEKNNWGKSKYFLLTHIISRFEPNNQIKFYIYSIDKVSKKLLNRYKSKIKKVIESKLEEFRYDKYFNLNLDQYALFNYTVIDDFEEEGLDNAINKLVKEFEIILNEYGAIFDQIITELDAEDNK